MISGGNFHGQPISQAMDILAIALAELGNISERRIECMMDPSTSDHLPPVLHLSPRTQLWAHDGPGDRGRALVSENKTLAHPACVDSIPTSANKEDFVSMGAFAALKAREVVEECPGGGRYRVAVRSAGAGVPGSRCARAGEWRRRTISSGNRCLRWKTTGRRRRISRS